MLLPALLFGAAQADWNMEDIVPRFELEPSSPVAYRGGYQTDTNGNVSYGIEGVWTGMPACTGTWLGPVTTTLPSTSRHLSIGLNTTLGFAVVEQANGAQVVHDEWRCAMGAQADPLDCAEDPTYAGLPTLRASPAIAPATLRTIDAGWVVLSSEVGNRSAMTPQSSGTTLDARVSSSRAAEKFHAEGVPFTGRLWWRPVSGSGPILNGDDFLLGHNLCTNAYKTGIGPVLYSATATSPMELGSEWTSGRNARGMVPLRSIPPFGDWSLVIEGCSEAC